MKKTFIAITVMAVLAASSSFAEAHKVNSDHRNQPHTRYEREINEHRHHNNSDVKTYKRDVPNRPGNNNKSYCPECAKKKCKKHGQVSYSAPVHHGAKPAPVVVKPAPVVVKPAPVVVKPVEVIPVIPGIIVHIGNDGVTVRAE